MYTVFVLLNAHCAEVMIGCAFINRQQGLGGLGDLLGHVHCCQFEAVTLEKGGARLIGPAR